MSDSNPNLLPDKVQASWLATVFSIVAVTIIRAARLAVTIIATAIVVAAVVSVVRAVADPVWALAAFWALWPEALLYIVVFLAAVAWAIWLLDRRIDAARKYLRQRKRRVSV